MKKLTGLILGLALSSSYAIGSISQQSNGNYLIENSDGSRSQVIDNGHGNIIVNNSDGTQQEYMYRSDRRF